MKKYNKNRTEKMKKFISLSDLLVQEKRKNLGNTKQSRTANIFRELSDLLVQEKREQHTQGKAV